MVKQNLKFDLTDIIKNNESQMCHVYHKSCPQGILCSVVLILCCSV